MFYLADEVKKVGDFGSASTVTFFHDVAKNLDLEYLDEFLTNGFTANIREVVNDIEKVDWPIEDGIADVAAMVMAGLMRCRGLCFLE